MTARVFLAVIAFAFHAQSQGQASEPIPPPAANVCTVCHGARGEGDAARGAPRIAGQPAHYLIRQLDSYVNGSRIGSAMTPIAANLPPEIRTGVAEYYAQVDAPAVRRAGGARGPARGEELATRGDLQRGVQACRNCHGPGGVGEPPQIPYLAGLDADYQRAQFQAWKDGTRRNDAGAQMAVVAKALTEDDISAVSRYYAGLPPPAPAPIGIARTPAEQKFATRAVEIKKEDTGKEEPVGVEQGQPQTGGTQGPGGSGESAGAADNAGGAGGQGGRVATDGPQAAPVAADPERGRAIVASGRHGCVACHTIPGIRGARGIVGPPLGGFADRAFIAGQLPNRREILAAFLQNPPGLAPRTGMPNVGVTPDEARHIAAFLHTLGIADGDR